MIVRSSSPHSSIARSPRRRIAVGLAGFIAVVALAAGCSSSDSSDTTTTTSASARYCGAWQKVVDAFQSFNGVTISLDGMKGLDTAINNVKSAVSDLAASADSMMKPKTQKFSDAVTALVDSLKSPQVSTDYLNKLTSQKEAIDDAWNDMIATAKTACPQVSASTV